MRFSVHTTIWDFGFHRRARPEQINDKPDDKFAEIQHLAENYPILYPAGEFTIGTPGAAYLPRTDQF
jgi:hypothetical protein